MSYIEFVTISMLCYLIFVPGMDVTIFVVLIIICAVLGEWMGWLT